jgi:hypothetical protein
VKIEISPKQNQILSSKEITQLNFMRNEANLEIQSMAVHNAWSDGSTRRRDNFESVRPLLGNKLVDERVAQINHELMGHQAEIQRSQQSLGSLTTGIANLISGKTEPKDLIEGAAADIRRYHRLLGR